MKKILFYILILITLLSPFSIVHGAVYDSTDKYTLLEPLPCVPTQKNPCSEGSVIKEFNLEQYIEYIFKFAIALAVILAVFMIIVGGFEYMLSESFTKKQSAKEKITNAVLGLLGALASYLILATIDPRLVAINTTLDPICPGKNQGLCNKSDVRDFQSKLSEDLNTLVKLDREKVLAKESTIKTLEQQKKDLQDLYFENDPDNPDYISDYDYEVKLQTINQEIRKEKSEQIKTIAGGVGAGNFQIALNIINSNKNGLKTADREDIESIQSIINKKSDIYVSQLEAYGDNEGAQIEKGRAKFFNKQINGEWEFVLALSELEKVSSKINIGNKIGLKQAINHVEDIYKEYSIDDILPTNDPELKNIAINLYKSRLERIKQYNK